MYYGIRILMVTYLHLNTIIKVKYRVNNLQIEETTLDLRVFMYETKISISTIQYMHKFVTISLHNTYIANLLFHAEISWNFSNVEPQ